MKGLRELDAAQRRALGVAQREHSVTRRGSSATRSAGKLRELRPLFAARGIDGDRPRRGGHRRRRAEEDALEVFETFEENALAKARYFTRVTRAARRSRTIRASRSTRSAATGRAEQALEWAH